MSVDYRVGIVPFNFNKSEQLLTRLLHGAAEVSINLSNPLNDRYAELDMIRECNAKIDSNSFQTGNTPRKLRCAVNSRAQH